MRTASPLAILLLLGCATARAAEPPPPDPARGERRDGRLSDPERRRERALILPRILLAPIRYLIVGLGYAFKPLLDFDERHHLHQRLIDLSTTRDGLIDVRPTLDYHTGFEPMFGLRFTDRRSLGPGSEWSLAASTFGARYVIAAAHVRPTRLSGFASLIIDVNYDRRADYRYTGIGNHAQQPNPPSRYAADALLAATTVRLRPLRWLAFDLAFSGGFKRFGDGDTLDGDPPISQVYATAIIPGFSGIQFLRGRVGVAVDTRDGGAVPAGGFLARFDADYSHGLGADDSSYFRMRAAIDVPIPLWRHTHVLDIQLSSSLILPTGNTLVPFSELAVLGGPDSLRGFAIDDFRDYSSLLISAEYRWPVWMWMDAMVLVDYGGVFGQLYRSFSARRMQPDLGFGVRLHTSSRFLVRAHIAYGFEGGGTWFYVSGTTP